MDIRTSELLGEELFAAYASGTLSAPMRLLVDTQADLDAAIAVERDAAEAIAGLMLENLPPSDMKSSALDEVFAAIEAEEAEIGEAGLAPTRTPQDNASMQAAKAAGQALDELLNLPEAVRDLALENPSWSFAGPGVRRMTLLEEGNAKAELIRLEPGHGVPHHGHNCREFTLVLCGAYHDGLARYGAGDLSIADPDTKHKPIAEPGQVCMALAITDGPLAFTGPLGWIQRTLGS